MVLGTSAVGGLATLHTRKSPSKVCVASMSDFCFEDDVCHDRLAIGEGAREIVNVWRIVKLGFRETSRIEPFI